MDLPLTAIISDLHANLPALTAALEDAVERGARRFWCLGDMIGYGAEPGACLDLVIATCTSGPRAIDGFAPKTPLLPGLCLRGNHEQALFDSAAGFNPIARAAIEWTQEELGTKAGRERSLAWWDFLDGLEPELVADGVHLAHASPRNPLHEYLLPRDALDLEKMRANFEAMRADLCFVGHSHVPAVYYQDGRLHRPSGTEGPYSLERSSAKRCIVNVGSVGQPRDGDVRLSYVLFDGERITFVRKAYDTAAAAAKIRAQPRLPERLAARLFEGR